MGDLSHKKYELIVKSGVANRTRQVVLCPNHKTYSIKQHTKHILHSFFFLPPYTSIPISSGIISNPLLRFARLSKNVFIFYANKSRDNNKVEILEQEKKREEKCVVRLLMMSLRWDGNTLQRSFIAFFLFLVTLRGFVINEDNDYGWLSISVRLYH